MESRPSSDCPHCGAPRVQAPKCPRCGAIYAKAEALAQAALRAGMPPGPAHIENPAPSPPLPAPVLPHAVPGRPAARWHGEAEDAQLELKLRIFAIPVALLVMWLVVHAPLLHMLQRVFLSMWIHELGHAITAWFSGFWALPGPWRTAIEDTRSPLVSIALAAGLGLLVWRGWMTRNRLMLAAGIVLLAFQLVCTLLLPRWRAQALILFGGDAGRLVLGSLLMMTFYASRDSQIYKGWLRWGFLIIGAAAFMDTFELWLAARTDVDRIPFGMIEGVAESDPTRLTTEYGWTTNELVRRYVNLGWLCLTALAAVYAMGLQHARAEVRKHAAP